MQLNFKDSVLKRFEFLESIYNYKIVNASSTEVTYESKLMSINVVYCPFTSEMNMYFKLKNDKVNNELRLIDLYEFYKEISYSYMVSEQKSLDNCLDKLSLFVQSKAVNLLEGNDFIFRKICEFSKAKNDKYNDDLQMYFIRNQLSTLWHEKKYSEIVKLLSPVQNKLGPVEIKKLEYAKKHS